jgi:AcrR family transcriptional regulator
MSPRPYKLGQRQLATDQTRSRIISATRELLADETGSPDFTVDAVARRAGVARMTVYYQFRSKRGLLEALFDHLANRGLMPYLRPVFHEPVPARALDGLIVAFAAFWNSDRIVIRRARALAALDTEFAESIRARDELRRNHLRNILGRLYQEREKTAAPPPTPSTPPPTPARTPPRPPPPTSPPTRAMPPPASPPTLPLDTIDVLHTLTSFETFDALLTSDRTVDDVTQIIRRLASAVLEPPS